MYGIIRFKIIRKLSVEKQIVVKKQIIQKYELETIPVVYLPDVFTRCFSLTEINYDGTYGELLKIVDEDWLGEEHNEIVLKYADQTVVVPKKEKRI